EVPLISYLCDKLFKDPTGISWSTCRFRVELHTAKRLCLVPNTFDGLVIHVERPRFPALGQTILFDHVAMILGGDIPAPCPHFVYRLVVTAVPIGHALGFRPSGKR